MSVKNIWKLIYIANFLIARNYDFVTGDSVICDL